jgi:hypothetical protein
MSGDIEVCFQNATGRLRTVRLEPWARHFLVEPDEKLEMVARGSAETPSLRVIEAGDSTLIYTERCDRVCVTQGGVVHELVPVYGPTDSLAQPSRRDDHPMWDRDLDAVV